MDDQQRSRWRPTRQQILWTGAIVAISVFFYAIVPGIVSWEWLMLLFTPAALAVSGFLLNRWGMPAWQVVLPVLIGAVGVLVYIGYGLEWTGFGEARVGVGIRPAKSLWDWLQFLIPLVITFQIAYLTIRFNAFATRGQELREERRAQDGTTQAYIDQMMDLLLNVDVRNAEEADKVRTLIGAHTNDPEQA